MNNHRALPWSFTYSNSGLADLVVCDVSHNEEVAMVERKMKGYKNGWCGKEDEG